MQNQNIIIQNSKEKPISEREKQVNKPPLKRQLDLQEKTCSSLEHLDKNSEEIKGMFDSKSVEHNFHLIHRQRKNNVIMDLAMKSLKSSKITKKIDKV